MSEEIMNKTEMEESIVEELVIRENPFCIISKETFGELNVRSIRTSTAWSKNPDPDNFVVVPDEMVVSVLETYGFCDIVLNDDETELVSFTAREIPELHDSDPEDTTPTTEERVTALEEQLAETDEAAIQLYEASLAQEAVNAEQDEAIIEIYETMEGLLNG